MDGNLNLRRALYPKMLNLIIMPTEKCNFRCTYCYETFEIGKMKRPTIDGVKALIKARHDNNTLEALDLSWFGGEPTLALDVLYEISEFANGLLSQGTLKHLQGDLTTNGYLLTLEHLAKLVALRQSSFQISLDGYGDGHDRTRQYASGKGTFSRIWANLLAAHESRLDFKITLRLHQTNENEESMSQLVSAVIDNFGGDTRFDVFFKTIENLGGPRAAEIKRIETERVGRLVKVHCERLQSAGFSVSAVLDGPESSKGSLSNGDNVFLGATSEATATVGNGKLGYDGYICYASKPNSLVIRADGRIGKCTVMLEDPRNTVGILNADGTVSIDDKMVSLWMRGFKTMDPIELGCPAQNLPKIDNAEIKISLNSIGRKKKSVAMVDRVNA